MALWIQISPGSKEPLYTQVYEQISQAIVKGDLAAGDKLPPVRKLAGELVINPNTVARAYTQLEQTGLVATKTGAGTFVIDPAMRQKDAIGLNQLCERLDSVISQAKILGLSRNECEDLMKDRIERFYHKQ
ncbi:MAG: GntR family transcriptional regulator [Planctomycetota bacterium]|jgi:GntR family transcriptional regulator